MLTLEELIKKIIKENKMDERIVAFNDYKTKYAILHPSVTVNVELTEGKVYKIDVTDYFKGVVK